MFFRELFKDLRQDESDRDPHPMWDLFKRNKFKINNDLMQSLSLLKSQKDVFENYSEDHDKLFEELQKDEELFDNNFWMKFLLAVRDQGCQDLPEDHDSPVHVSCSGKIKQMRWSQIEMDVVKEYGDIFNSQIAIPEFKIDTEDKNILAKSIEEDFKNKVKDKTEDERERIRNEMKNTPKARRLHDIRAKDAEMKIMDEILQYCKV